MIRRLHRFAQIFLGDFFPTFQRCLGVRVPLFGRRQVEVWFVPRGQEVPLHIHRAIDSRLLCLWGRMNWRLLRVNDGMTSMVTRCVFGPIRRRGHGGYGLAYFKVPAGVGHAATVLGKCGIFLNLEKCRGVRVSAAVDFQLTTNGH